jgi:N-methylhydantoinase B
MAVDAVSLEVFRNLFASVAEEMGVTLGRTAYSPNIKERRDFSCAVFDERGRLVAQAEHIPVHLGAMPASVAAAISRFQDFEPGDLVALNDPYLGGTHLPDLTLVSPVFTGEGQGRSPVLVGFVASRAHHADVGGMAPGSMPASREVYQEGFIVPPIKLARAGKMNEEALELFFRNVRTPDERRGDLAAQTAANRVGEERLRHIIGRYGLETAREHIDALIRYGEEMVRHALRQVPIGTYRFRDEMEARQRDGAPLAIQVAVTSDGAGALTVDFDGTSPEQTDGNLNAVLAVTTSAVLYCVRCLAGPRAPANHGAFAPVTVLAREGTLVNPRPPRAVAAGNVETSQRIVDAVFGALAQALPDRIPAASQGTMNNTTIGGWDPRRDAPFAYYETLAGGVGGGPEGSGASAVHSHMTNTMNTPVEALEYQYPFRVLAYSVRRNSGGGGHHPGGDGLVRTIQFLAPATVSLLTERRSHRPWGLAGGQSGVPGRNALRRKNAQDEEDLPPVTTASVSEGDVLTIETPGGGGWGAVQE